MRKLLLFSVLLVLVASACSTLSVVEIKNIERQPFEPLMLRPGVDPTELKIDILRQSNTERINDSTSEIQETPYHPLGFDLGNGLFYDLNENLNLKISSLLNIAENQNFELEKSSRPGKKGGKINYLYMNDTLRVNFPPKTKKHYCYDWVKTADSIAYRYKNHLSYAVVKTDSSLIYRGKRRKWNEIVRLDSCRFYSGRKLGRVFYEMKDGQIYLGKYYLISLSNDAKTLEIKTQSRGKSKTIFTMIKSADKLFVFDKRYMGLKIEHNNQGIQVYTGSKLITQYNLKLK